MTGSSRLICLESDNESESGSRRENLGQNEAMHSASEDEKEFEWNFRFGKFKCFLGMLRSYID